MDIDISVQVALVSMVTSALVLLLGKLITSRFEKAQANSEEGNAAKALSEAAKLQISTYNEEIVIPLRKRIDDLENENATQRQRYSQQIEDLQRKVQSLDKTINSQREQIVILMEQSESKDKTIRQMQAEIEQLQRENEMLRVEISKLIKENDVLKTHPVG